MAPLATKLLAALALAAVPNATALEPWPAKAPTGEGEDLLIELADIVLANDESKILPIPFEMILDRDVGYVGAYPIKDNLTAHTKFESLNTVREVTKGLPPHLSIVAAYVKDNPSVLPQPAPIYRIGGSVGGEQLQHLNGVVSPSSELTVFGWQKNKVNALLQWLQLWNRRNPNYLVLIHSSGDVLYGGCEENIMLYKYHQIVEANGGTPKIVLGAEVSPYPSDMGWSYANAPPHVKSQMSSALESYGLSLTWASAYANCTGGINSICDATPMAKYANGGFIMGPAGDVLQMFMGLSKYVDSESRFFNEYFLENTDKVGLDYSGTMFMSLHNMVKNGELPVEVVNKSIKSKVTNNRVCFVQGNGNSLDALKGLAKTLKDNASPVEVEVPAPVPGPVPVPVK